MYQENVPLAKMYYERYGNKASTEQGKRAFFE
jgi:hypothetical protein